MRWVQAVLCGGMVWVAACGGDEASPRDARDASEVQETGDDTLDPDDTPDTSETDGAPGPDDNFGAVESEGDALCDNLDPGHCLFPFPSDRFRVDGHLAMDGATPRDRDGVPMGASAFAGRDGWSPLTPLVFTLPGLAIEAPEPIDHQPFDIARSLAADSPIVIVRADDGERVPCWLERDHFAHDKGATIAFVRVARPLAFGARYVVAVRGLTDADGAPVSASPGFAALRDQTASAWRGVHARRAHFEANVFPVLAAAGVARDDLQLAWDFTTATEANTTGPITTMRERLYAALGEDGPAWSVDGVDGPDADGALFVRLTVQAPSFFTAPDGGGVRHLRLDAEGLPLADGTEPVAVDIRLPASALADPGKAEVVQYGHGLFWSREEASKDWLVATAARENLVLVGSNMEGMSEPNIPAWANTLATDMGQFPRLAQWPMQGIMNHLAVQRLLKRGLPGEAAVRVGGATGTLVWDPTRVHYYGNSQGGTLGATAMALTRDVGLGVLGVPGCAFSYLIHKSVGFTAFATLIQANYPDPYDFAAILGLVQTGFDPVEPLDHAASFQVGRRVLLQVAKEDATVDNLVSFTCGRAYGATLVEPAVRPVWGLPEGAGAVTVNALAEYDFGHPDNPDPFAPAPKETDTHEDLRRLRVAQDQWVRFIKTGETVPLCDGVCDPD